MICYKVLGLSIDLLNIFAKQLEVKSLFFNFKYLANKDGLYLK